MPDYGYQMLCREWGNLSRWKRIQIRLILSGWDKRLAALGVHLAWFLSGLLLFSLIDPSPFLALAILSVWFSIMAAAHFSSRPS